jgi:hypothetical protein
VGFPPGNIELPTRAIASGIIGATVRTTLVLARLVFVVFGGATALVVVRFVPGGVTVVFFGGMAKPHLLSATRPRARPVRRTNFQLD